MKITLFLLLLVIFQVYNGNCYSQNARVSIQNARLRVGQVLEQIESQTEYLFVYNKQNVDVHRTVDIHASNQTVSEVLDQMFKGTDIKYVMEGKNIVLTKNSRSAEDKTDTLIIRKSKFPWFPERSVQFSGKRTKRSVQKKGYTQHL